jgi:hypothetical protein
VGEAESEGAALKLGCKLGASELLGIVVFVSFKSVGAALKLGASEIFVGIRLGTDVIFNSVGITL